MADMLLDEPYDETWAAEDDEPDDSAGLMSHDWERSAPSYSADDHAPPDAPPLEDDPGAE